MLSSKYLQKAATLLMESWCSVGWGINFILVKLTLRQFLNPLILV